MPPGLQPHAAGSEDIRFPIGILTVVLLYALFASLWIVYSDRLLASLLTDSETLSALSTLKGILFVVVTSFLLYWLMRRLLGAPRAVSRELHLGVVAWPRWSLYAVAAVTSLAAMLARQEIAVAVSDRPLLVLLMLPVIVSAALGGFGPGLLASTLVCAYAAWIIPPAGFGIAATHDVVQWGILLANGLLISVLSEILHQSRHREYTRWRQLASTQEQLRRSEARFEATFEQAAVGIALLDTSGRWLRVNHKLCEIVGYEADELLCKNFRDITHPDDLRTDEALVGQMLARKIQTYALEKRYFRKDGTTVWINLTVSLTWRDDATPDYFIAVIEDIRARKAAEQALQQNQAAVLEEREQARLALLNQMEDAIAARRIAEAAAQEVRELNAELEQRVIERTAQLDATNKELEAFTYSVSHDLKAPLRGIDGYSRLLQEECMEQLSADCRTLIDNVRRGAEQMNTLIEDLLSYSRIERRPSHTESMPIAAIVQQAVAERSEEISRQGVQLRMDLPEITMQADPDGLLFVLRNLLDNALKFTRNATSPTIEIGGHSKGETSVLWVRDNGIGFDMKFHERIFEIFQRLHRTEDFPGTGIGLAIVRKAMQRMGGRVWAESQPGSGATFYLELPQ